MRRFSNILYVAGGADDSPDVFERAVALAENNQAGLTVAAVLEEVPPPWHDEAKRLGQAHLERLAAAAHGRIPVATKLLHGTAFIEVIREVLRHRRDLVVKPAAAEVGLSDRLFGSSDMHLLRKCPVPVWIMRPAEPRQYRRILAAVDFGPGPAAGQLPLNRDILEFAASLATAEFSELHVAHAWDAPGEGILRTWGGDSSGEQVATYVEGERRLQAQQFDDLMQACGEWLGQEALDYLKPQMHLRRGSARLVIPQLARELDADLLVLGTVGRTGIRGLIVGNTAETILTRIDCSVLAVKPPGFESPVTLD
jgi:universal stress protein E